MNKKIIGILLTIFVGICVFAAVDLIGGTNEIMADGHTFTITEVTNDAGIELTYGDVDASQHWDYNNCYAPAFIVTIDGAEFFGYCIDVDCQYTPSATYTATKIEGDEGRLAATILTFGFHGGESIVDETDQGVGWRDTWLALRNVLDVDRAWSSDGSIALMDYCNAYLLPEGSYCYRFDYNDGQTAQAVVAVPVRGSEFGNIQVTKTDEETGQQLTGATFEISGPSGVQVLSDGESWTGIEPGEYVVKELTAPHGYTVSNVTANVTVKAGKTEVVNCADERIKGKIKIHKTGEARNSYTIESGGIIYPYEDLQGAVFELYASEDIVAGYGDVIYEAGDLVSMMITDQNGDAEVDNLFFGEYYLVETSAPEGYRIIEDSFDLTVDTSENIPVVEYNLDCVNYLQKGNLTIHKMSSDDNSNLAGAEFAVYDAGMNLICHITSGEDGYAKLSNLLVGDYYYQETKAPDGFVVDSTIYNIHIDDGATVAIEAVNEKERGSYNANTFYDNDTPKTTTTSSPNTGLDKDYCANLVRKLVPFASLLFVMVFIFAWRRGRKQK